MSKIVAVVSLRRELVGGGAPIFIAPDEGKLEEWSFLLEKIMDASAHQLNDETMILVDRGHTKS